MKKTSKKAEATEKRREGAQRKRNQQKERRQRKVQEQQRKRSEIRAREGNLFNHISRATHDTVGRISSNLRFSLGLRISLNYGRLLFSMTLRAVPIFCLAFLLWQGPVLLNAAGFTAEQLQRSGDMEETLSNLWEGEAYVYQLNSPTEVATWEAQMPEWLRELRGWVQPISGFTLQGFHPVLITRHDIVWQDQRQVLFLQRDIWPEAHLFLQLLSILLAFDLIRAFWFLVAGRRINRKVLRPIADMTQHAQTLSEHDLSLRLNIEGTKNELKDLALVINEMLDRIETAYNGQKQFVSDASHELRTPIAVIQGYAALLQRWGKDSPQVRDEALTAILGETENMKQLVEKLLFLARHDKHTLVLQKEHFDIRALVEEVIRETEMITSGHVVETGRLDSGIVYGDKGAIKQAIRIFIDNAVKYTPAGGHIRISCTHRDGMVCIGISDTGIGMNKKEMQNIFERFYRADEARNSKIGGHGLGLSIAKIIILSHDGKIHVRSQKGEGTTFEMVLPI